MHNANHLYIRGRAQSQYFSTQKEGTKPNAQSKLEVTILGDNKNHKQRISQYKILKDRFCNESSSL